MTDFYKLVPAAPKGRFEGVERTYTAEDVMRLRGSVQLRYTLAEFGAALAGVHHRQRAQHDLHRTTSVGMSEWVSTLKVWLPCSRRDSAPRACEAM